MQPTLDCHVRLLKHDVIVWAAQCEREESAEWPASAWAAGASHTIVRPVAAAVGRRDTDVAVRSLRRELCRHLRHRRPSEMPAALRADT